MVCSVPSNCIHKPEGSLSLHILCPGLKHQVQDRGLPLPEGLLWRCSLHPQACPFASFKNSRFCWAVTWIARPPPTCPSVRTQGIMRLYSVTSRGNSAGVWTQKGWRCMVPASRAVHWGVSLGGNPCLPQRGQYSTGTSFIIPVKSVPRGGWSVFEQILCPVGVSYWDESK